MADETRTVYIPARREHQGLYGASVHLVWTCPKCGGERGAPYKTKSYDGSRYLEVDGWSNPCGHIDYYDDLRREARDNGLNQAGVINYG
jgi:RNase P subunit RPR2